jgi:hypothetical protein
LKGFPVWPTVTMRVPGAKPYDYLGRSYNYGGSQGVLLADVSGDGLLDVIASSMYADSGKVSDAGAVYVWVSGPDSVGTIAPTATLLRKNPRPYDRLSYTSGQGVHTVDVTGDGILDVVVGASYADLKGRFDPGAIFLFKGGPSLKGKRYANATLTVSGAAHYDRLCENRGNGMHFADLNADGVLDVIAAAIYADIWAVTDVGSLYMWAGGPDLSGKTTQTTWFTVPGAEQYDNVAYSDGAAIQIADVTGDGHVDMLVAGQRADVFDVWDSGAIFMFEGGPQLSFWAGPSAALYVPDANIYDSLGYVGLGMSYPAVQLVDVNEDGVLDVVVAASRADYDGLWDAGSVYYWEGPLSGAMPPKATLRAPEAGIYTRLGYMNYQGVIVADVTDDGVRDIVVGAPNAPIDDIYGAGAVYVWSGEGLEGLPAPAATLTVPNAVRYDFLGSTSGHGIRVADVTGDDVLDLVVGASYADLDLLRDTGAVYVFQGGPGLKDAVTPMAELRAANPIYYDRLGRTGYYGRGSGIQLIDLTGDGILDLLVAGSEVDQGVIRDAGAIFLWEGGPQLLDQPVESVRMTVPTASSYDRLGG